MKLVKSESGLYFYTSLKMCNSYDYAVMQCTIPNLRSVTTSVRKYFLQFPGSRTKYFYLHAPPMTAKSVVGIS